MTPTKEDEAGSYQIKIKAKDQIGKDEKGTENLFTTASILVIVEAPPKIVAVKKIIVLKSFLYQITSFDT